MHWMSDGWVACTRQPIHPQGPGRIFEHPTSHWRKRTKWTQSPVAQPAPRMFPPCPKAHLVAAFPPFLPDGLSLPAQRGPSSRPPLPRITQGVYCTLCKLHEPRDCTSDPTLRAACRLAVPWLAEGTPFLSLRTPPPAPHRQPWGIGLSWTHPMSLPGLIPQLAGVW